MNSYKVFIFHSRGSWFIFNKLENELSSFGNLASIYKCVFACVSSWFTGTAPSGFLFAGLTLLNTVRGMKIMMWQSWKGGRRASWLSPCCDTWQQQSHCLCNFVARRKTWKAFAFGLNLGQPIGKSRRLRRILPLRMTQGSITEIWTLQKLGKRYLEDWRAVGQSVVREMGRVHIAWCALLSGGRGRQKRQMNVTLPLTPPCSSQANRNVEQQLETVVTAADGTLQRGYRGAPVPSLPLFLFINGLFS